MAERSRDRSSSTESQPKFPECSHFRRRNDNHRRCQPCRLNDGLPLCTQDSPCLMCQDWLPEAWTVQAKAIAQRNRRKAAAAAKAARKETEMMDDSVELHAPRDAFPTKRTKSEDSSKAKGSKTVTSSSQPKSVASSVTAVERPSSPGSDHRRSRAPERKEGTAKRDVTSLRGISRHVVTAPAATGERASGPGQVPLVGPARVDVPSPAVSRRRQTPVRRALPLAIISIILRAIVDPSHHLHHGSLQTASLSPFTARDEERAPTGRVGRLSPDGMSSYLLRSPRPLRNALSWWLPRRVDRFILNRPQQFQSRPRQFQFRPRQRTAQQVRARQQAVARPRVTSRQRATARSQAKTRPQVTARPQATARPQTLTTQQMSRWWSHHIILSYILMIQTIWMVQHLFQQRE